MVSIIHRLIPLLERLQNSDGSFNSLSSSNTSFKGENYTYTTNCSTAYIAFVLSLIRDSEKAHLIQKNAVEFLGKNKSPSQTWNYWSKDSPEYEELPYPDDADDTFASLIALYSYNPDMISGKSLATIVNGLTAIEKTAGGPYYTWYTSTKDTVWKDIDCVANSQIAHFLDMHSIELPKLTRYFERYIRSGAIMSQYYPSSLHCMYFIARWYRGKCKKFLSENIVGYMESKKEDLTPLELALGISSLLRLGENSSKFTKVFQSKLNNIDLWNKPYPWCIDPARDKKHYYSGSPAITLASAIEAYVLLDLETIPKGTLTEKHEEKYFDLARTDCLNKISELPEYLRKGAKERILLALDTTAGEYCITSPCIFISACNLWDHTETNVIRKICYAQACGWIAYEIFDDVVDERDGTHIGIGLHFYTDMLNTFNELLEGSPYLPDVNRAVSEMNTALVEDADYMKTPNNQAKHFSKNRVLQKSAGYILGLLSSLHHLGFDRNSEATHALLIYQQNIILALQLSDDAHDWLEDIDNHQRNSVVDMLPKLMQLTSHKREEYFWKSGINDILHKIKKYCDKADAKCISLEIVHSLDILQAPITKIRKMCRKTIQDREIALEFLKMYSE